MFDLLTSKERTVERAWSLMQRTIHSRNLRFEDRDYYGVVLRINIDYFDKFEFASFDKCCIINLLLCDQIH